MASKFVRSVKDIYHLENFNTNLVDENDILSTIDGDVYIYTKNGFLHLDSIDAIQDEVQEVQEKLSDNEQRIYNNEEKIKLVEYLPDEVQEVQEKLSDNEKRIYDNEQKIDSINIDDLKQEQKTLSEKIDEKTNETNEKINKTIKETNEKIQSNTDKINAIHITDTGWQEIQLNEGFTLNAETPQYRITTVNDIKMIDLRGGISGIKENKKQTIGKIPLNKDLTNRHYFIQNTSMKNDDINYGRWVVEKNGELICYGSTDKELTGNEWFSIATSWKD